MLILVPILTVFLFASTAMAATCQVRPGDTLYLVSKRVNTTVTALKMVNHLSSEIIYPGQSLEIPLSYQVRPGESWYLIGKKYGLSPDQLKRANETGSNSLYAGQTITIPIKGGSSSPSTAAPSRGSSYSREDTSLLARLINGEARGEPYVGQVAVGAVVLNRAKNGRFPGSINGVVFQPGAFTAVDDGQIWLSVTDSCMKAAAAALSGWDPSGGAIYYYNPWTATNQWIRTRPVTVKIGNHIFAK
ncbi:MAG: LysM peptidoglycan-binding domain-containing protein [Firmicutes bacterium]|nr:LysM peptidoglycan-binding domain-containing protein [Bacillota bacterium]